MSLNESTLTRYIPVALLAASVILSAGCEETLPTATDPALIPVAPTTVEVRVNFSDFGRDVVQTPGFGRVGDLNTALVADQFDGVLDARTLVRFGGYPEFVQVSDPSGVVVTDSTLSFVGGTVLARIDTLSVVAEGPVVLIAGALRGGPWDHRSATWTHAVDTIANSSLWPEEGAGPVDILDTVVWDPTQGDSVVFQLDSATANAWADTTDLSQGLRIAAVEEGARIEFLGFLLNLDIVPSARPDTLLSRPVGPLTQSFVYSPPPAPPGSTFRVGGAPSWRTTFGVTLADTLNGPPELCEVFGCPFKLTPESVNFAAITFQSAPSPPGFQPDDTLSMDLRAVLNEDQLPKSPLSNSLAGILGIRVPPDYFGTEADGEVTVGITSFIQDLIRGETSRGDAAPQALSLLTPFEPLSLELLTFHGAGSDQEPVIRMILTTRVGVPLR